MITDIDPAIEALQRPDKTLVLNKAGKIQARLSLWWKNTPLYGHQKLGYIGHFEALDALSANKILQEAYAHLKKVRCTVAIGPMDGSTWFSYRWITDKGHTPLFLTEPVHSESYPTYFEHFGFLPIAKYSSSIAILGQSPKNQIMEGLGITVKPLDLGSGEPLWKELHRLSDICFMDNFLYSPISYERFCQLYLPFKPLLLPEFVWGAYEDKTMIGFVFCIPDLLQKKAGHKVDQVILKTLAVHPDYRQLKVGSYLVSQTHQMALNHGYKTMVHALMHEKNITQKMSRRYGKKIREYTLYKVDIV